MRVAISKSLELPDGYQQWGEGIWYTEKPKRGISLNNPDHLSRILDGNPLYLFTLHQLYYQDGIIKQTRSSPNFEGGVVTFATCKHNMRTYNRTWKGTWIACLCPKEGLDNCVLLVGKIHRVFDCNLALGNYLTGHFPVAKSYKLATSNPRGDIYTADTHTEGEMVFDHTNYEPPKNHTRSVETYKKSPGSENDGKPIPKWWRDIEYCYRGRRPKLFLLRPCCLFNKPMLWTTYKPGRAALKLTGSMFDFSLKEKQP